MDYILTSSDGLRISDVHFQGQQVFDSAKLVDYHVSYSKTEGFGYSDAIGCPIFSQAAVLALEPPQVEDIVARRGGGGLCADPGFPERTLAPAVQLSVCAAVRVLPGWPLQRLCQQLWPRLRE